MINYPLHIAKISKRKEIKHIMMTHPLLKSKKKQNKIISNPISKYPKNKIFHKNLLNNTPKRISSSITKKKTKNNFKPILKK